LASGSKSYPRIAIDFSLSPENDTSLPTAQPIDVVHLTPEEEIAQVNLLYQKPAIITENLIFLGASLLVVGLFKAVWSRGVLSTIKWRH